MNNFPESFPELSELLFPKITKVAKFVGGLVTKVVNFREPPNYVSDHYVAPLDTVFERPPYSETALDDYWHGVLEHGEE